MVAVDNQASVKTVVKGKKQGPIAYRHDAIFKTAMADKRVVPK